MHVYIYVCMCVCVYIHRDVNPDLSLNVNVLAHAQASVCASAEFLYTLEKAWACDDRHWQGLGFWSSGAGFRRAILSIGKVSDGL